MKKLSAALVAATLASGAHAASITPFTTAASFDSAVTGAVLETFDTLVAPGRNNLPGVYDFGAFTIEKEYPGGSTGSQAGSWRGKPTSTLADVIVFDEKIDAWGAVFNTTEGGNGTGIQLAVIIELIAGSVVVGTVGAGADPNNGFLGFTSDVLFDTLRLTSVGSGSDTYLLDNMRYRVGEVPLPAPVLLLLTALAGLAFAARRKAA